MPNKSCIQWGSDKPLGKFIIIIPFLLHSLFQAQPLYSEKGKEFEKSESYALTRTVTQLGNGDKQPLDDHTEERIDD